ncbi:hypothetical protein [Hathewaya limosa]|uniref:Uncharacterized protein n=1 Tax=Hathewaya limosa TaxID=1536 RepID=A0ABU0JV50_HATLI|nr:hypothetical protein [Hathewaya limosa]MDQ0479787.1 hypothetical protein [Hathewaya limosa]
MLLGHQFKPFIDSSHKWLVLILEVYSTSEVVELGNNFVSPKESMKSARKR